jgi:hypothetical protein
VRGDQAPPRTPLHHHCRRPAMPVSAEFNDDGEAASATLVRPSPVTDALGGSPLPVSGTMGGSPELGSAAPGLSNPSTCASQVFWSRSSSSPRLLSPKVLPFHPATALPCPQEGKHPCLQSF